MRPIADAVRNGRRPHRRLLGHGSTSAVVRESPLAGRARKEMDDASDQDFVVAATVELLSQGGRFRAEGKLDWDYSAVGGSLLTKAKHLDPDNLMLGTLSAELPPHRQPPTPTLRVGGDNMAKKLVRKVAPAYPPLAKANHIEGTVTIEALVGLDGRVLKLRVENGPPELVSAAVKAARQWEYKPTLPNGSPCYVITRLAVSFRLV